MATSHHGVGTLPASTSAVSPTGLLSIGKVSEATGLCIATLRRLDGSIPSYVLPSGHRRYRLPEVMAVLKRNGLTANGAEEGVQPSQDSIPICLVTRVSSPKDSQKTSLVNQKQRLEAYVAEQFGGLKTRLVWNKRVASGLNFSHPKLVELFQLILNGSLDNGYILACFKDRILRFGHEVVELLCKQHNVEVRYIDQLDAKTENEELTEDLLSVLTHYTAKASGNKTRKLYAVQIDETTASLIFELRNQKVSLREIAHRLEQEGKHLDRNGRPLSYQVIFKFLKRHGGIRRKLLRMKAGGEHTSPATPVGDSLAAFLSQHVLKNELTANGKPVFTVFKTFYSAYEAFCDQHQLIAHSRNILPKMLRSSGFKLVTRRGYLGLYAAMRTQGVGQAQICIEKSRLRKTQPPIPTNRRLRPLSAAAR